MEDDREAVGLLSGRAPGRPDVEDAVLPAGQEPLRGDLLREGAQARRVAEEVGLAVHGRVEEPPEERGVGRLVPESPVELVERARAPRLGPEPALEPGPLRVREDETGPPPEEVLVETEDRLGQLQRAVASRRPRAAPAAARRSREGPGPAPLRPCGRVRPGEPAGVGEARRRAPRPPPPPPSGSSPARGRASAAPPSPRRRPPPPRGGATGGRARSPSETSASATAAASASLPRAPACGRSSPPRPSEPAGLSSPSAWGRASAAVAVVGHGERADRRARGLRVLVADGGHGAPRGLGVPGPLDLLERGDPHGRLLREHLLDEVRALRPAEGDDGGTGRRRDAHGSSTRKTSPSRHVTPSGVSPPLGPQSERRGALRPARPRSRRTGARRARARRAAGPARPPRRPPRARTGRREDESPADGRLHVGPVGQPEIAVSAATRPGPSGPPARSRSARRRFRSSSRGAPVSSLASASAAASAVSGSSSARTSIRSVTGTSPGGTRRGPPP